MAKNFCHSSNFFCLADFIFFFPWFYDLTLCVSLFIVTFILSLRCEQFFVPHLTELILKGFPLKKAIFEILRVGKTSKPHFHLCFFLHIEELLEPFTSNTGGLFFLFCSSCWWFLQVLKAQYFSSCVRELWMQWSLKENSDCVWLSPRKYSKIVFERILTCLRFSFSALLHIIFNTKFVCHPENSSNAFGTNFPHTFLFFLLCWFYFFVPLFFGWKHCVPFSLLMWPLFWASELRNFSYWHR